MGLRSVTVGTSTSFSGSSPTVLYSDSNWGLQIGYSTNQVYWRSRLDVGPGESATGRLDFGIVKLKSKLTLPMAGGGATNGNLKTLQLIASDNTLLVHYTLAQLLGNINTDWLKIVLIDTSAWSNTDCIVRLFDGDIGTSWAWMAASLKDLWCY